MRDQDNFDVNNGDDPKTFSDQRKRESNVKLDWDGIQLEEARRLEQRRLKGVLTKVILHVSDALLVGGDVELQFIAQIQMYI